MRYDRFDPTGEASTPGSYAFLMPDGDATRAVETYEELRTESTVMRINTVDADGVTHAAFYEGVEVGDVVEWLQADDCWARYQVTSTPAGAVASTRDLGVVWMTYAFTGCSRAVPVDTLATIDWAPSNIQSPITIPIRHGPWQLVPSDWTGARENTVSLPAQHPEESYDVAAVRRHRLWREPDLPPGWRLRSASVGYEGIDGVIATYVDAEGYIALTLQIRQLSTFGRVWSATTGDLRAVIVETRIIDSHPAYVRYSPTDDPIHTTMVRLYNRATGVEYLVLGGDPSISGGNIDAAIEIARSLLPDPPEPGSPVLRYDHFDPTGEALTPGSYAFLMPDGDTTRAVETYEELRNEATVLVVHDTDGDGKSQADFYDAVEVDDIVAWRSADRCWVRYRITELPTGTAPVKEYAVEPYSYSYGGCSGTVPDELSTEFRWRPPNLSTPNITVPFLHGPVFVWPNEWAGSRPSNVRMTPAAITWPPSPLPDPDLGDEWTGSVAEGYGGLEGYYSHRDHGWSLTVYIGRLWTTPDLLHMVDTSDQEWATEYLLIDGKPAYVTWHLVPEFWSSAALVIYDLQHDIAHSFEGMNLLRDDPEALVEIARKFLIYPR